MNGLISAATLPPMYEQQVTEHTLMNTLLVVRQEVQGTLVQVFLRGIRARPQRVKKGRGQRRNRRDAAGRSKHRRWLAFAPTFRLTLAT